MSVAPGPVPEAAAHVFVPDVAVPDLDEGDRHHLLRVLRIRPHQVVTASDGAGRWAPCRLGAAGELERCGEVGEVAAPRPPVTVALALTKGARVEVAVQKLTELGVDAILAFSAARSVTRWEGERPARHLERLRRVAREAAMQSRRMHLPRLSSAPSFADVADIPGAALAQPGGSPPSLARPVLLVGPEGGWAPEELAHGLPRVGLGPQVLRSETAAIVAGALLVALRSGVLASAPAPHSEPS